jgi:hypothetical protein
VTLVSQCGKERKKGKFSKKNSLKNIFLKEIVFLSLKNYNNQILFIKTINKKLIFFEFLFLIIVNI